MVGSASLAGTHAQESEPDMSDKLPDWLEEFSESVPDDELSSEADPPTRQPTYSTSTSLLKSSPLTPTQLMVLGGLAVILCVVCSGILGFILVNGEALFGSPSQSVAAAPPPEASLITPEPSPTGTHTPTPTSTLALVKATSTP